MSVENARRVWTACLVRGSSCAAQAAAQRHLVFQVGLFADPIFFGDYPLMIKSRVPHLRQFTPEQSAALKGSVDYYAMNHYTSK
jgi:beta-glucosidase